MKFRQDMRIESPNSDSSLKRDATCPLCGGFEGEPIAAHRREFIECDRCHLIFVPKSMHISPESERQRYDCHQNDIDDVRYTATFEPLIKVILSIHPPPADLLDFGCHRAKVLVELLSNRGYRAVGYDPHYTPPLEIVTAGILAFEIVTSTETIEHFAEPFLEFERMTRLLAPGGVLGLMTRFHPGIDSIAEWWYARDPTHVAFYSRPTFEWISRKFNLEIVESNDRDLCVMKKRA